MIVIERDGQRTVITGWRAWLIYGVTGLVVALILVVIGALLLGVALTVGVVLLFAVPLAFVLALIARLVMPRQ